MNPLSLWGQAQDWLNQFPGPWNLYGAIQYPKIGASDLATGNVAGLTKDATQGSVLGFNGPQIILGVMVVVGMVALIMSNSSARTVVATTAKGAFV